MIIFAKIILDAMNSILNKLVLISVILLSLGFSSCGDDDTYYLKYEVKTSSRYVFSEIQVEITTENGVEKRTVSPNWEGTFGPIRSSSEVILNVTYPGESYVYKLTSFTGRISISKNNEPFVLKAEETANQRPLSMSYKLD